MEWAAVIRDIAIGLLIAGAVAAWHRGTVQRSVILAPWDGSWPSKRCGSHEWEPTYSAVPGPSATQSDCSCRSRAPRSTQSDGDRQLEPFRNSLTRKRSLVQIQYGPRFFECMSHWGAKRGAQGRARTQADPVSFRRFKIEFMAVAPVLMTGLSWCLR